MLNKHIFESHVVDFYFSMKRVRMDPHDKPNDQYLKYLMTKFDRIIYMLKIGLDAEQASIDPSNNSVPNEDNSSTTIPYKASDYFDILYKFILFTRDITYGMGEKTLCHMMIFIWHKYFPVHACAILNFLPQYDSEMAEVGHGSIGTWKDIVSFCQFITYFVSDQYPLIETCVGMLNHQLHLDIEAKEKGQKCSYVSKWIPRENSKCSWLYERCVVQWIRSFRPHYLASVKTNEQFQKALRKGKTEYRKIISDLCKYNGNVQHLQCTQQWSQIDLSQVSVRTKELHHNAFLNVKRNGELRQKTMKNDDRLQCRSKSQLFYMNYDKQKKEKENQLGTKLPVQFSVRKHLGIFLGSIVKNIMDMDTMNLNGSEKSAEDLCKDIRMVSLFRSWKYTLEQIHGFEHVLPVLDLSLFGTASWWDAVAMAILIAIKSSISLRIMAYEILPIWIDLSFEGGKNILTIDWENETEFFRCCLAMFRHVNQVGKCHNGGTNLAPAMYKIHDALVESKTTQHVVSNTICIVFSAFAGGLTQLKNDHVSMYKLFSNTFGNQHVPHMVYWNMNAIQNTKGHHLAQFDSLSCVLSWSIHNCHLENETVDLSQNQIDETTSTYTLLAGGSSTLLKHLGRLTSFEWKYITSFQILTRMLRLLPYVDSTQTNA